MDKKLLIPILLFGIGSIFTAAYASSATTSNMSYSTLEINTSDSVSSESNQSPSHNEYVDDSGKGECEDCDKEECENCSSVALEGNYNQWSTLDVDLKDPNANSNGVTSIDDNGNFIVSGSLEYFYFANGTFSMARSVSPPDSHTDTMTHKYYVLNNGAVPTMVEIFSNAKSIYNMTIDPTKFHSTPNVSFSISPNGKYVILAGEDICNCGAHIQVWEGSLNSTGGSNYNGDDDKGQFSQDHE